MVDFSLSGYRHLVGSLLKSGYRAVGFGEVQSVSQGLVLRHDVDFCPEYCVPISVVERELGVSSVYYFLVSSAFYNVMEPRSREVFRVLSRAGHEIGLHFDVSPFNNDLSRAEVAALAEIQILETAIEQAVTSVSFHRPVPELLGKEANFAGRPHAYQPRFFRDLGYLSDSTGRWRYGHPLESQAYRERRSLQLLTHPIWWHRNDPEPPSERLQRYVSERAALLGADVAANTTVSLSFPSADRDV